MTLKHQFTHIIPLLVVVGGLLAYNFMSAQWIGPTASAPGANVRPPINIGTSTLTTQTGLGNLVFNRLVATNEVRSDLYCNATGSDCINYPDINRYFTRTLFMTNTQSGVGKGQKVSVTCQSEGTANPINGSSYHQVLTGGGCRVTGAYDELSIDEGDVFSYPLYGTVAPFFLSTWNCENKNLATTTIEATAVCMEIIMGDPPPA